jgi:hypothetical protein
MYKFLLALLLVTVSHSAMAEWEEVGSSDTMTAYVDADTLSKKGNKVKMWWMVDISAENEANDGTQISMKFISEFDCQKNQLRQLYTSSHSEGMGEGATVSVNYDTMKWKPIAPDSLEQSVFDAACSSE